MSKSDFNIQGMKSQKELAIKDEILDLFGNCPIPKNEILNHLGLFINRQAMSRIMFLHEMYQRILNVHGVVIEFGVRWGQSLALFESFRGMYEPFNHNRKIIGFDTFEGFPSVHDKDGIADPVALGSYAVTENYEQYLSRLLDYHEQESPLSHIKKYELVKGDATVTIERYLKENPETIIAMAFFDFDIYEPTKACLEAIKGHLAKGSVIGFDQLNHHDWPGETLAFKEVFGLDRYRIIRAPYNPCPSYIVIE